MPRKKPKPLPVMFNRNVQAGETALRDDHVPVLASEIRRSFVATPTGDATPWGVADACIEMADGTVHRRRFACPDEATLRATCKDARVLAGEWLALWIAASPPAPAPETGV